MSQSTVEYLANRLKVYEPPFGIVGIGLPGTNKSEVLRPLADALNPTAEYLTYKMIEAQMYQADINFNRQKQSHQVRKTWAQLYRTARVAIEEERPVIIDATNTSEKRRWTTINQFRREMGVGAVVGVYFKVDDPEVALERILARRPTISTEAFEHMSRDLRLFAPSRKYENFDDIIEINAEDPTLPIVN